MKTAPPEFGEMLCNVLRRSALGALGIAFLLLQGCTAFSNSAKRFHETDHVDSFGAFQLIDRLALEQIHLPSVLDPYGVLSSGRYTTFEEKAELGKAIDFALAEFNKRMQANPADAMLDRNRVQERLLHASRQRCSAFKTNLQREFARNNFVAGMGSTVFGVLGSLVPGVQASRNFAGLAGISSGYRAEYNQNMFSNLAVNVVSQGIAMRQDEFELRTLKTSQKKTYADYPVEAAIKENGTYFSVLVKEARGQVFELAAGRLAKD